MKHSLLSRWFPLLLLALCPPLLGHCGGAAERGTETGNPPVVEQQKLHVSLRATGVEVVGEAGAVSPGASVRVTNRTSGESVEATAGADGSIQLVVPGSLQDEYDVTVSNGAGSQTVRISAQPSGGASGTGGTAATDPSRSDPVACAALQSELKARVSAGFANVDKSCQRDEDCFIASTNTGCYASCDYVIASRYAADPAQATTVAQDIAPLCAEFASQRCENPYLACAEGYPSLTCNNGTCATFDSLSCEEFPLAASAHVAFAINTAAGNCSRDADCALVSAELSCVASCGNLYHSVPSSALEGLTKSIAQTDARYCGSAESRGCPAPIALPCVPMTQTPQATCNDFLCRVTYTAMP